MGVTGLPSDALTDATAPGKELLTAANKAAQRTALELGTAATTATGTSAGQIPVLDGSARLPAVDGSQLTNIPGGVTVTNAQKNNDFLIPRIDGFTTNSYPAQTLQAMVFGIEFARTITQLNVNVSATTATAGSLMTLALCEEWINGNGHGRPGTVIEQGTVPVDSTGNKTLSITPYAATVGERLWVVCWTAATGVTTRVSVHTGRHQTIWPYWNLASTSVNHGGFEAAGYGSFPVDLTAVTWGSDRYITVIGLGFS